MARKPSAVKNSPQGDFIKELRARPEAKTRKLFEWRDALAVAKVDSKFPTMSLDKTSGPEAASTPHEKLPTTARGNLDHAAVRDEVATQISDQHTKRQKMRGKLIAKN